MALPPAFLDELRARTPLAAIIGRRVKLARSGKQWKGCCPFHGEKSPSFYVYDDGYHCFGCGAHGDAISFVMQTQGAGFPEAVAQLAGEAGLEVPKATPEAAVAEQRRTDLHSVLEKVVAAHQRRLWSGEGAAALAYLRDRGLSDDTIRGHGLGWSGETRGVIATELAREGINAGLLVEAGVLREREDGRAPYDLFARRIMFPIRDARGRAISLGGRILGEGQPKYLNGPETALFSKKRTLFGLDRARAAARAGQRVVVVEGYLDVIALHQAGFEGAVAPLGTALTDLQLEALWRLSPAPVLCFDGDAAGARAAARAMYLALPMLTPEQTLSIARMPEGEDPDSFIRRRGKRHFKLIVDGAVPLAPALFNSLHEGVGDETEQRAGFIARLKTATGLVRHPTFGKELQRDFDNYFYAYTVKQRLRRAKRVAPSPAALDLASNNPEPNLDRCHILIVLLLNHPAILHDEEEMFAKLDLPPACRDLQTAMLAWATRAESLDSMGLMDHLAQIGLSAKVTGFVSLTDVSLPACARADAMPAEALAGFWHFVGLMQRNYLDDELLAAERDLVQRFDDIRAMRVIALKQARDQLTEADLATETA